MTALRLSALLGEKDHVHLLKVAEGSAVLVHAVEDVSVPMVRARILQARVANTDSPERRAFESIDQKLREDGTTGYLREDRDANGKLLVFPGKSRDVDPEYGPFKEQGSVRGRVIGVGGKMAIVNVNIQDGEVVYYCEASQEIALQLAPLMFRHQVEVFGIGRYVRNADAEWEMRSCRISHFEELDQRPLSDAVDRLRTITRKVGLDRDILKKLADLRADPTEA